MFDDDFTKIEKTNVIPLRLFANFCNKIGTPFLLRMFYLQDYKYISSGFRWNLYGFIWKHTNSIYMRWGTYYKMNIKLIFTYQAILKQRKKPSQVAIDR